MNRKRMILLLFGILYLLMIIIMITYFVIAGLIDSYDDISEIKDQLSEFEINPYYCAHEFDTLLVFQDHELNLRNLECEGNVSSTDARISTQIYLDNLYFSTIEENYMNSTFRLYKTDYYGNDCQLIYTKDYDGIIDVVSYDKCFYFSRRFKKINENIQIESYDIVKEEYLGVVCENDIDNARSYLTYLKGEKYTYEKMCDTSLAIYNLDTGNSFIFDDKYLSKDIVGKVIVNQKKWSWAQIDFINNKLFVRCSIVAKKNLFDTKYINVVFEVDENNYCLNYQFYFESYGLNFISILAGSNMTI